MQSWGVDSIYNVRRTQKEPTKSGVVGLIAASMGRRRDEAVDALARLRFGVRVDQEGEVYRDYHTAKSPVNKKDAFITHRYYIEDAAFLAGLESEDKEFLEYIHECLRTPSFAPFLGRRACPPTYPLTLGIREAGLEQALFEEPWLAAEWRKKKLNNDLPVYVEYSEAEEGMLQKDVPISFDIKGKKYGYRYVKFAGTVHMDIPEEHGQEDDGSNAGETGKKQHDPMQELRREACT